MADRCQWSDHWRWRVGARLVSYSLLLGLLAACGQSAADRDLAYQRGLNAMQEQQFDWARLYFGQDVEQHPDRVESWRNMGIVWRSGTQQSTTQATYALRRYLKQRPEDTEMRLLLARSLLYTGEWSAALRWLEPLEPTLDVCLVRATLLLKLDPSAAWQAVSQAIQLAPQDPKVHELAAQIAFQTSDLAQSFQHAQQAAKLGSLDHHTYYVLANVWRKRGKLEQAKHTLETQQMLSTLSYRQQTAGLSATEKLPLIQALETRLSTRPYVLRKRKLRLLFEAGQTQPAIQELEELQVHPHTTARDRVEFARAAEKAGQLTLAEQLFRQALEQAPAQHNARTGLARLAYQAGDFATTQRLAREGLQQAPYLARYHYLLGRVALRLDDIAAAKQHLHAALRFAPWEIEWRLELIKIYLADGAFDRIRTVINDAPQQDPRLQQFKRRNMACK